MYNKQTPWIRVLLKKLIVIQVVNKLSGFYGTQRFITIFTRVCHWSLSWVIPEALHNILKQGGFLQQVLSLHPTPKLENHSLLAISSVHDLSMCHAVVTGTPCSLFTVLSCGLVLQRCCSQHFWQMKAYNSYSFVASVSPSHSTPWATYGPSFCTHLFSPL